MYDVPMRYRATYQRARSGKSPRAAIKAHCLMCCGWQLKEVKLCIAPDCPLYPLRTRYFRVQTGLDEKKRPEIPRKTKFEPKAAFIAV